MVSVHIEGTDLIAEVEGSHKLWAFTSKMRIPLQHIKGVYARPEDAMKWFHGWKVVGTDLPGRFAAGLFRTNGKWVFWDIVHPEKAIELDLEDEFYNRVLIEVADPDATAKLIRDAIEPPGRRTANGG